MYDRIYWISLVFMVIAVFGSVVLGHTLFQHVLQLFNRRGTQLIVCLVLLVGQGWSEPILKLN